MDQHTRHVVPSRRRERKTVFADSRWRLSFILSQNECERIENKETKQEEKQQ